jgi:hypothetical protein
LPFFCCEGKNREILCGLCGELCLALSMAQENHQPINHEYTQEYRKKYPGQFPFKKSGEVEDKGKEHTHKGNDENRLLNSAQLPYPEYAPPHARSIAYILPL